MFNVEQKECLTQRLHADRFAVQPSSHSLRLRSERQEPRLDQGTCLSSNTAAPLDFPAVSGNGSQDFFTYAASCRHAGIEFGGKGDGGPPRCISSR